MCVIRLANWYLLWLWQAMAIAAVMEFTGSVALGKSVTGTIAGSVLSAATFANQVDTLMLAMVCALVGSSLWVNTATVYGMPVSSTHAIVGAVVGVGMAMGGTSAIRWGTWNSGVVGIVVGWAISPVLAGLAAAAIYLPTKYLVLRPNSLGSDTYKKALWAMPLYMFVTMVLIMWFMFYKGFGELSARITARFSKAAMLGLACCTGVLAAVATQVLVLPLLRCRLDHVQDVDFQAPVRGGSVAEDSTMAGDSTVTGRAVHAGSSRQEYVAVPDDSTQGASGVRRAAGWVSHGELAVDESDAQFQGAQSARPGAGKERRNLPAAEDASRAPLKTQEESSFSAIGVKADRPDEGDSVSDASFSRHSQALRALAAGSRELYARTLGRDVISVDAGDGHLVAVHARAERFGVRTEGVFAWVQVVTCSFASLAHGANDVANAVGPLATIYYLYHNGGTAVPRSVPVNAWLLVYGGIFIVTGLALRGWHIMVVLGNNMTPISPSRGFAMELGTVLSVLIATVRGLPVSTTQCITGAVVFVGLCNGDIGAVNWRMVSWTLFGWVLTVPIAGIIAGVIFSIISFSPKALDCSTATFINGHVLPTCTPRIYGNLYSDVYVNATTQALSGL
eukprot:jgi/Mesvir1/22265/Mv18603-RA.1